MPADDEGYRQHAAQHRLVQSEAPPGARAVSSHRAPWKPGLHCACASLAIQAKIKIHTVHYSTAEQDLCLFNRNHSSGHGSTAGGFGLLVYPPKKVKSLPKCQ